MAHPLLARLSLSGASIVLLAAPRIAEACAVCAPKEDETTTAFLVTTIFLSLLPLGMIAGVLGWLWRRVRQRDEEDVPEWWLDAPSEVGPGPGGSR